MIIKTYIWKSKKPETVMHDMDLDLDLKEMCGCGQLMHWVEYPNTNPKTQKAKPITHLPIQQIEVIVPAVPATLISPEIPETKKIVWMTHWPYCKLFQKKKAEGKV